MAMGREHLLDESDWLLLSRRRRFRIGDLMVAIALAAVALSVGSLSNLTGDRRLGFALLAPLFLGLQAAQWRIAGIAPGRVRPGIFALLCILSFLMALLMFACLIILGLIFPEGLALVVGTMIVMAIYLTTWD
jgi:peptidoglycan/LPS O-acetylase OafA/YrhL